MAACDKSETAGGFKHVKGRPKRRLPGVAVRLGLRSLLLDCFFSRALSRTRQHLGRLHKLLLPLPSNEALLKPLDPTPDMPLGMVRDTCQCRPAAPEPQPPAASPMVLPTAKP